MAATIKGALAMAAAAVIVVVGIAAAGCACHSTWFRACGPRTNEAPEACARLAPATADWDGAVRVCAGCMATGDTAAVCARRIWERPSQ